MHEEYMNEVANNARVQFDLAQQQSEEEQDEDEDLLL